jgi:exoribonuclease R
MSLKANTDVCALSLGVEIAEDGSIIDSSIVVTPSQVRVSYRLTYDEVDEMLEEGAGYSEEWQLGALLLAATKRRAFRTRNGSTEAFIPTQIPQHHVSTFPDRTAPEGIGIHLNVEVANNGGKNQSTVAENDSAASITSSYEQPVSSASMLVTGK